MTKILLTGITGYIGGAVLTRLSKRNDFDSFDIRCIIRSPDKAKKLKELFKNVTPIVGSHDDIPLISKAASEVDLVVAMAETENLHAATGTLQGLKKRFEETGKQPIFINTSGTDLISDTAHGMFASEDIWDDMNLDQMESLNEPIQPPQPARFVNKKIVTADTEGYIKSYLIVPSCIWGISQGPLYDTGISNPVSQQIPVLIRTSLDRGHAGMEGLGKSVYTNVEITDVGDLYNLIIDAVLSPSANIGHGPREGYYFCTNEEHNWYQVAEVVSEVMRKLHKGDGGPPTAFTEEEIDKYFNGIDYFGPNARSVANRARDLGWAPKHTTNDMLASIEPETLWILSKNKASA